MKKSIKLISILMVALMIIMQGTSIFAADTVKYEEVAKDLSAKSPDGTTNITGLVSRILGFLQWAAIIGGIIIITVLGIKYMMGSLEEKAQYQKSFVPLIVGIVVVMGASTIANVLFKTFAM